MSEPRCPGPFTIAAPGRGEGRRKREEGGGIPAGVGLWAWAGGGGRKYLCSHLNVNQVWLEQGSRDRGGGSKREPDGREEAEMGVVRGRGRGPRERARARQCWGHWERGGGGQGTARGLTSKATEGDRAKAGGLREDRGDRAWEVGSSPSHTPCTDGNTEAGEAKGSVHGHTAKPGPGPGEGASLWVP